MHGCLADEIARQPRAPLPPFSLEAASQWLLNWYGSEGTYRFRLDHRPITLPVLGQGGLRIPLPGPAEQVRLRGGILEPPPPTGLEAGRVARYASRFLRPEPGVWNDRLHRLTALQLTPRSMEAEFAEACFFDNRFTCGLMREELSWALATGRPDDVPLRRLLAPDRGALRSCGRRITAGGVQTLCAFAGGDGGFVIPLQVRGLHMNEGGGTYGVVPMGFHQPAPSGSLDPAAPSTTALREVFEELFGGGEHRPGHPAPAAFLDHPAIAWIRDHPAAVVLEMTSFFLTMLHGNFDFGLLLAVLDPGFWRRFGAQMEAGWESQEHLLLHSRDAAAWERVLSSGNWESQARGVCVEGLLRLRELAPDAVNSGLLYPASSPVS